MILKKIESGDFQFWIDPETGEFCMECRADVDRFPAEDATELLVELRKQQLEYLQRKQDQEDSLIIKLLRSIWKG